jgi:hypothetical protein
VVVCVEEFLCNVRIMVGGALCAEECLLFGRIGR